MNIEIMRAFVRLRELLSTHKALKLKQLEMRLEKHDEDVHAIFEAIRQLTAPPEPLESSIIAPPDPAKETTDCLPPTRSRIW